MLQSVARHQAELTLCWFVDFAVARARTIRNAEAWEPGSLRRGFFAWWFCACGIASYAACCQADLSCSSAEWNAVRMDQSFSWAPTPASIRETNLYTLMQE